MINIQTTSASCVLLLLWLISYTQTSRHVYHCFSTMCLGHNLISCPCRFFRLLASRTSCCSWTGEKHCLSQKARLRIAFPSVSVTHSPMTNTLTRRMGCSGQHDCSLSLTRSQWLSMVNLPGCSLHTHCHGYQECSIEHSGCVLFPQSMRALRQSRRQ